MMCCSTVRGLEPMGAGTCCVRMAALKAFPRGYLIHHTCAEILFPQLGTYDFGVQNDREARVMEIAGDTIGQTAGARSMKSLYSRLTVVVWLTNARRKVSV